MSNVIKFRPRQQTKAVYVRAQTVGFSGADSVYMKVTLPRAPWDRVEDAAPDGGFRQRNSGRERLITAKRRK